MKHKREVGWNSIPHSFHFSVAIVVEGKSCPVSVKTFLTPSWSLLEFVPPNPGMASVAFTVLGCRMSVYPNSFEVLPLAL